MSARHLHDGLLAQRGGSDLMLGLLKISISGGNGGGETPDIHLELGS